MIRLSRDTLFVHPIPDHLAQHVTTRSGAQPHLVYRIPLNPLHCKTGICKVSEIQYNNRVDVRERKYVFSPTQAHFKTSSEKGQKYIYAHLAATTENLLLF